MTAAREAKKGHAAKFTLSPLPYAYDALAPHMSEETLKLHHDKHHKTYVEKLNELLEGSGLEDKDLVEVVKRAAGDEKKRGIFNNAGQAWNHALFWLSLSPQGGGEPTGAISGAIDRRFGGMKGLKAEFKEAAVGLFGSGWVWLVAKNQRLDLATTKDGEPAFLHHGDPLIAFDVWEHAYYVDFRNDRAGFVDTFLEHLIDWRGAERRYSAPAERNIQAP
jgi:superoxide dismutase, Fe-Mn family